MVTGLPMLAGMAVLRVVTAAHLSATQAGAEMDPLVAQRHALLANVGCRRYR